MKRTPLAVSLIAAGLAACADNPATPLAPSLPPDELSAGMLDPRAGLAVAVDDARYRVISTLGTSGAVQGVDRTFAVLANAVRSGDPATVRDAIAGASGTLNALERSAPETDAVEVAALRLVLLNADALFPAR